MLNWKYLARSIEISKFSSFLHHKKIICEMLTKKVIGFLMALIKEKTHTPGGSFDSINRKQPTV